MTSAGSACSPAVQVPWPRACRACLQVQFHKGYFFDSLPHVRKAFQAKGGSIALLRMDGEQLAPSQLAPLHVHVPCSVFTPQLAKPCFPGPEMPSTMKCPRM